MNFKHLEYAVAVARYNSIRKAAQNLFISQPYLSGTIKNLEEELGYTIFNRSAAGITPTPLGEEFISSATYILQELEHIRNLNQNYATIPLNIASYYSTYIMEIFLKFREMRADFLADKIREMGNEEIIQSVSSRETDMGIIFYASEKKNYYDNLIRQSGLRERELLPPMPVYFLMSREHPLANTTSISMEQLASYSYVSYDDISSLNYLKVLEIPKTVSFLSVSNRGGFYDALHSGHYLTVSAFMHEPKDPSLCIVPIDSKKEQPSTSKVNSRSFLYNKYTFIFHPTPTPKSHFPYTADNIFLFLRSTGRVCLSR